MSQKLSRLLSDILPAVEVLSQPFYQMTRREISRAVSDIFIAKNKLKSSLTNKVGVYELHPEQYVTIHREINSKTFSFNIVFKRDGKAVETEHTNKMIPVGSNMRPTLNVVDGQAFGYNVFTSNGIPVFAIMSYSSNFNGWAKRIKLRQTQGRKNPSLSTHYVFNEEAKGAGLLWINPVLENGGDLRNIVLC